MAQQMTLLDAQVTGAASVNAATPLRTYLNPGHNRKIAVHGSIVSSFPASTAGSVSLRIYEGGQGESTLVDQRNTRFSSANDEKNILRLFPPGYLVFADCAPLEVAVEITGSGVLIDTSLNTYYSFVVCNAHADPTAAAVTDIAATTATFNGTITPNTKGPVTWIFQHAEDAAFGATLTDTGGGTIIAGTDPNTAVTISEGETGLTTSTTYYVRLKVTDGSTTIYSENVNFTTA